MTDHTRIDNGGAGSFLHGLNPLSKLVATLPVTVMLTLVTNIWTPCAYMALNALLTMLLGRVGLLRYIRSFIVLLPVVAGFALTYPFLTGSHEAGLQLGMATGLRMAALYTLMLLFTLTTDTSELVRALMQQWRLPAQLGYTVLAVMRFMPELKRQYDSIRRVYRLRGLHTGGWKPLAAARGPGIMLPVLAAAVRQAERVALSMEARAFGAHEYRTYYRKMSFSPADGWFIVLFWLLSGSLAVWLDRLGLFGRLSFLKMFE